jgi:hypothetical protein
MIPDLMTPAEAVNESWKLKRRWRGGLFVIGASAAQISNAAFGFLCRDCSVHDLKQI